MSLWCWRKEICFEKKTSFDLNFAEEKENSWNFSKNILEDLSFSHLPIENQWWKLNYLFFFLLFCRSTQVKLHFVCSILRFWFPLKNFQLKNEFNTSSRVDRKRRWTSSTLSIDQFFDTEFVRRRKTISIRFDNDDKRKVRHDFRLNMSIDVTFSFRFRSGQNSRTSSVAELTTINSEGFSNYGEIVQHLQTRNLSFIIVLDENFSFCFSFSLAR